MIIKILVCGGRHYADRERVNAVLDKLFPVSFLIHGGATGADELASQWARGCLVPEQIFGADWNRYGRAAGPLRNQRMIDEGRPDLVVAFPGGKGTRDMVNRARRAGITILEVA